MLLINELSVPNGGLKDLNGGTFNKHDVISIVLYSSDLFIPNGGLKDLNGGTSIEHDVIHHQLSCSPELRRVSHYDQSVQRVHQSQGIVSQCIVHIRIGPATHAQWTGLTEDCNAEETVCVYT